MSIKKSAFTMDFDKVEKDPDDVSWAEVEEFAKKCQERLKILDKLKEWENLKVKIPISL